MLVTHWPGELQAPLLHRSIPLTRMEGELDCDVDMWMQDQAVNKVFTVLLNATAHMRKSTQFITASLFMCKWVETTNIVEM